MQFIKLVFLILLSSTLYLVTLQAFSSSSSSLNYLEQSKGLQADPFIEGRINTAGGYAPEDALYFGISPEDQGRKAYLKARLTMAPQTKRSTPWLSSQEVGWQLHGKISGKTPPFARRPIIKGQFLRQQDAPMQWESVGPRDIYVTSNGACFNH